MDRLLATDTYHNDPVSFCRYRLKFDYLWSQQADILTALLEPPYRVSVDSGHNIGKTCVAGAALNWWFETRPRSVIITTAPTERDVVDLLWAEVRMQRNRAGLANYFLAPSAPLLFESDSHYAKGFTARKDTSFQGRHRENMLFIFDEKEAVDSSYWDAARTMFRPGSGDAWLVIGNPLTTTSRAYFEHKAVDEKGDPSWRRFRINALDHPNIAAGLAGQPLPVPGAVTVGQMDQWIADWCDRVIAGDERPTDIRWRGQAWRPGPIAQPRILGLRPSQATKGVWSEEMWELCVGPEPDIPPDVLPVIGCDCANYGDDYTTFHVRCGPVSLFHQAVNGWPHDRIAHRLTELAKQYAQWINQRRAKHAYAVLGQQIVVNIDDDATGRAISTLLMRQGYHVNAVNAAADPERADLYPNTRSELWFQCAKKALRGLVNFSRLGRLEKQRIEQQLMAPEWWPDTAGRRVVEAKDETKEKIGRSPDDADGVNLAYYERVGYEAPTGISKQRRDIMPQRESSASRRGIGGR